MQMTSPVLKTSGSSSWLPETKCDKYADLILEININIICYAKSIVKSAKNSGYLQQYNHFNLALSSVILS